MPRRASKSDEDVFLNVPYHPQFDRLFLAYIAGTVSLGLVPRTALEVSGSQRRLDRIFELLESCRYSVHDLSWTRLDRPAPITPRFNMPFELGLAAAYARTNTEHRYLVFEAVPYRLQKSLSDLNGTDPYIHGGNIRGVLRAVGNAFARNHRQPGIPDMYRLYRALRNQKPTVLQDAGADSVFEARPFHTLVLLAQELRSRFAAG